jgi:signal transduction histidine kinase
LRFSLPQVARTGDERVVAGVCAGIAQPLAVDPTLVRLTFALLAFASGAGIVAYAGAWAMLPAPGAEEPPRRRRVAGTILLVWSAVLALRGVGLSDSLVWPMLIAGVGVVLLSGTRLGLEEHRARIVGVILVVIGVALFAARNSRGTASTLLAPGAVAVALLVVLAPWAWRLARDRARAEERADLAARVHDSVLQTLTLIQKDPSDARRLARRQERELRAWLYPATASGTIADAVDAAAAEVEELHGVRVDVVHTGNAQLDERSQALVLAAREAMTNAAKHAGVEEISVFVEPNAVYVRDRGQGFDPQAPTERSGIAESIRGRMERVGGTARITSAPGEGTEVELVLHARRLDGAQKTEGSASPTPEQQT